MVRMKHTLSHCVYIYNGSELVIVIYYIYNSVTIAENKSCFIIINTLFC